MMNLRIGIGMGRDEEIILQIHKHMFYLLIPLIFTLLTSGLLLPWLIYCLAKYYFETMILTNKKFHITEGIISKDVHSVPLSKIGGVSYHQNIFGRILGFGSLQIQSSALEGLLERSFIKNPLTVKTAIEEAIDKYEKK